VVAGEVVVVEAVEDADVGSVDAVNLSLHHRDKVLRY
jgi:hypothetical protein